MGWIEVGDALKEAKAITFDGCHKIYILMDDEQVAECREIGYDPILPVTDPNEALGQIEEWYEESCGLRFVDSIRTVEGDPNLGFTALVPQGWDDEDDEDEDEDEDEL